MANTKELTKQYEQLSEKERAALMITADINNDDHEFRKLKASAPVKWFRIKGDRESEIGSAWLLAHKDYLISKNFLLRRLLMAGNLGKEEAVHFYTALLLQEQAALDLAFYDVLAEHNLPIYQELLEGFCCEISNKWTELAENESIKRGEFYKEYSALFSATCTASL